MFYRDQNTKVINPEEKLLKFKSTWKHRVTLGNIGLHLEIELSLTFPFSKELNEYFQFPMFRSECFEVNVSK